MTQVVQQSSLNNQEVHLIYGKRKQKRRTPVKKRILQESGKGRTADFSSGGVSQRTEHNESSRRNANGMLRLFLYL